MSHSHRSRTPKYRHHRPSGQAVVTLNGKDHYLGKHDTPESHSAYDSLLAKWLTRGRQEVSITTPDDGAAIEKVILLYWQHATTYYRQITGEPTKEQGNIRLVLRRLRRLYGNTPAAQFDNSALEALRDVMIRDGLCRTRINKDIARLKRMFKWAVSKKLVPATVCHALGEVAGLQAGRSDAKERPPVKPVSDEHVDATLPHLTPQVAAMVRLQRLAGMRPGEVTIVRGIDIDISGDIWLYRPGSDQGPHGRHKNAWRGHDRVIALGPKAQEVLRPWLRKNPLEYLFQPCEARIAFDVERRARRKSKVPPSQQKRTPKKNPKKTPGDRYCDSSYTQAVGKGCQKARVPHWSPNRLRHRLATEVRKRFGLEAAQVALGHTKANVTEVYAERDQTLAIAVATAIG